ncbi:Nicotinate-nucleotide--dimethylbenzimidazole phosphoribosyltransferase (Fragment) OS=Streptomyces microflavus OX=1919 GN=cobT PE=3 SV=1 [Streptomyces microflavus]
MDGPVEEQAAETAPAEPFTPPAPGYDDAEREAVLRVMRERRDIRNGFRSDPIPREVLLRVLEAAHTAPSVGHSQPWDFVVIRSAETRRSMHELAQRQREAYAKSLPKGRAKQFKELKIEAILDTPVNIVVAADPTRGGRHTLGRHTRRRWPPTPRRSPWRTCGWRPVPRASASLGQLLRRAGDGGARTARHLEVVAYLCVGYVDEFPGSPTAAGGLVEQRLRWSGDVPANAPLPGEEPHDLLQGTTKSAIRPLDAKALGEAWERQKRMTDRRAGRAGDHLGAAVRSPDVPPGPLRTRARWSTGRPSPGCAAPSSC